jgi:hypothetical protein
MLIIYLILLITIAIQFSKFNCQYNKSKWATILLLFISLVLLYVKVGFSNTSVINLGKFGKFI